MLSSSVTGRYLVGGLVGHHSSYAHEKPSGPIESSTVDAIVSTQSRGGGITGESYLSAITDCQASGTVTGHGSGIGGLVGAMADGVISRSHSTSTVTGFDSAQGVGGLLAYNFGTVRESYATGAVVAPFWSAGLIAENRGVVENCYASGSVYAPPTNFPWVPIVAGGLVAENRGRISSSYSSGSVGGSNSTNMGGLVGSSIGGTTTDSYWDVETSGLTTSAGGTGATTAQMQDPATFVGWDFTNVWLPPSTGIYPTLR